MANALTYEGEEQMLQGDGTSNGSLARKTTKVKLFDSTSVPVKGGVEGGAFVQVANGNGYATGGNAITQANWTFTNNGGSGPAETVLDDQVWTASGGSIANIKGAYLTDSSDVVLAWWERASAVTLADGDSITLDDLTVRLT